ncbi:hypothetical protein CDAR_512922 [Caerostris darwini]|uniref:Uncharacterized protein n=1 Tax=Caerostris darwini TaxID=1538125 RepID=A0AAV4S5K6_9ARAC|nr:hypothetical protein CDAR_512922 [Caerostris darwini]
MLSDIKVIQNEIEAVESWLDEHPQFVHNYFIRKASRNMIDSVLFSYSAPQDMVSVNSSPTSSSSGVATPFLKTFPCELESRTCQSR